MTDATPLEPPPRMTVFDTPIIRPLLRWISIGALKVGRWTTRIDLPDARRYLIVVAPHTSYWDFLMGLAWAFKHRQRVHWFGKQTLFRGPGRPFFRWLGGIPIDPTRSGEGRVPAAVAAFKSSERLVVAIAPEATLRPVERWRSGFYHIALGAGIPIALGFIDYGTRTAGVGGSFLPTEDEATDWGRIRDFYAPKKGRNTGRFLPPINGSE